MILTGVDFIWWKFITRIQGARCPFSTPKKVGDTKKLFDLSVILFLEGPPTAYVGWVVGNVGTVDDCAALLPGLPKKNK